ncbi:MAG: alpha/beta hydrolase [Gammaproteobacteria bacterium]|nr:MAG: alpha/beta hydrolase [Gammaproteobacteria bacterium]
MPLAPEYEAMFAALAAEPGPKISELSPAEGREMYRIMRAVNPELSIGSVEDRHIDTEAGSIPIRIYRPAEEGPLPIVMNFHGGGWVIGDLDTADSVCRSLSEAAGCIVISVDYRLAPEHVYPAAVEDAYAATCWAAANADALGGSGKLAVTGESAGGNLATVVCQKARDEDGPHIDFQLLAYPVVDHDLSRPSYDENGEGYLLEKNTMVWFWDHYCPPARRSESAASPLLADSLADLPPAVILTAEYDPLRDEGKAYADALSAAGVPAKLICFDGLVHDFLATAALFQCSKAAFEQAVTELKRGLA